MLLSALILCEKLQPWKLKCSIFSLCSCALYPDFTQAAQLGWPETLCWAFGTIQFLLSQKLLLRCQFPICCHTDSRWIRLDPCWTNSSAQPSLPAVRSPASREQRWSLAQAFKGTGKCRLRCWSWSLRVQLDYSWNCLGCFEVVEGLGVPLAGHVQGRVLHPKCSLWWVVSTIQGEPDILVRPGCPPCFASGHSAVALLAAQPAFISPTIPVLVICSS